MTITNRFHQGISAKLDKLVVRKEGLLCTDCGATDPVHPGDGVPASAFIMALEMAAKRHIGCSVALRRTQEKRGSE